MVIPEATLTAVIGFTSLNYQSLYDMSLFPLAQSCDLRGGFYYVVSNPRARCEHMCRVYHFQTTTDGCALKVFSAREAAGPSFTD